MKSDRIKACLIPALALTVIAAVVTAALAAVNAVTKDTIEKQVRDAETAARKEVVAQADRFEDKTLTTENGDIAYCEAYEGDTLVGYVFTVTTSGKSSGLTVMTGLAGDGSVLKVAITEQNETAGYVDKVTKDGLLDRIAEKNSAQVDATSNATRTSNGVMKGVQAALDYYKQITEGGAAHE